MRDSSALHKMYSIEGAPTGRNAFLQPFKSKEDADKRGLTIVRTDASFGDVQTAFTRLDADTNAVASSATFTKMREPYVTQEQNFQALQQVFGRSDGMSPPMNPQELQRWDMHNLPAAYVGKSVHTSILMMNLIAADQTWVFTELAPITAHDGLEDIVLDTVEFDAGVLTLLPWQATGTVLQSSKRRSVANILRWGGHIVMDKAFWNHPEGQKDWARRRVQLKNAMMITLTLGVWIEILHCERPADNWEARMQFPYDPDRYNAILDREAEIFAVLQKQQHPLQVIGNYARDIFKARKITPGNLMIIIDEDALLYTATRPEFRTPEVSGKPFTKLKDPFSWNYPGLTVRAAVPIEAAAKAPPINLFQRHLQWGSRLMFDRRWGNQGVTRKDFLTDHLNIHACFSKSTGGAGNREVVSYRAAVKHCGVWNFDPAVDGMVTPDVGVACLFDYQRYESEMNDRTNDEFKTSLGAAFVDPARLKRFSTPTDGSSYLHMYDGYAGKGNAAKRNGLYRSRRNAAGAEGYDWIHDAHSFLSQYSPELLHPVCDALVAMSDQAKTTFFNNVANKDGAWLGGIISDAALTTSLSTRDGVIKNVLPRISLRSRRWIEFCMDYNIPFVMHMIVFIPHKTFLTSTAVVVNNPGAAVARTYLGGVDMALGSDSMTGLFTATATLRARTFVPDPNQIVVLNGVAVKQPWSGDWNHFHPPTTDGVQAYRQNQSGHRSMFSVWVPPNFSGYPARMDITGSYTATVLEHSQVSNTAENGFRGDRHYPTADLYRSKWQWKAGSVKRLLDIAHNGPMVGPNTVCIQTLQFNYTTAAEGFGSWSMFTSDSGMGGPNFTEPGFARMNVDFSKTPLHATEGGARRNVT